MTSLKFVLEQIDCYKTTEGGHDEVYYMPSAVLIGPSPDNVKKTIPLDVGPSGPIQLGDAGGPKGDSAKDAWDCNDSGLESHRNLNVELFRIDVNPGDRLSVSILMRESDGNNYADIEKEAGAMAIAAMGVITLEWPVAAVVTVPAGAAIGVATALGQALHSLFDNHDDDLGSVTFILEVLANGDVWLQQMAVDSNNSALVKHSNAGVNPSTATVHMFGDGSRYDFTFRLEGAHSPMGWGFARRTKTKTHSNKKTVPSH